VFQLWRDFLRTVQGREFVEKFGQRRETPTQRREIARADPRDGEPGNDPLDVADAVEVLNDRLECCRRFEERGDRALARVDVLGIAQRRP
jgi:hypothetical protein